MGGRLWLSSGIVESSVACAADGARGKPDTRIVWPVAALVVAAVAFSLPLVRSTWWMNPDNYALLAWGRQVASFHQITLENGLTTPHPLPMALAALLFHGGTPIGFFTFLSALARCW